MGCRCFSDSRNRECVVQPALVCFGLSLFFGIVKAEPQRPVFPVPGIGWVVVCVSDSKSGNRTPTCAVVSFISDSRSKAGRFFFVCVWFCFYSRSISDSRNRKPQHPGRLRLVLFVLLLFFRFETRKTGTPLLPLFGLVCVLVVFRFSNSNDNTNKTRHRHLGIQILNFSSPTNSDNTNETTHKHQVRSGSPRLESEKQ